MKRILAFLLFAMLVFPSAQALAAEDGPALPPPLKALQEEGAQIKYLGRHEGLDGWITMKEGQEQYFYAPQGGNTLLMGLLFNNKGELITVQQVRDLQRQGGDVLDFFAAQSPEEAAPKAQPQMSEFKTPSEQLYDDVQNANWITLGAEGAPAIYMFADPQCPHCHAFLNDLRKSGYLEKGQLQVRVLPVGFKNSKPQAAFLLAVPDPKERLYRFLDGEEEALPMATGLNLQGVERNMAIMQSWRFDVTPLTVYKAANGKVKIVQGRAKSIPDLVKDLTSR